MRTDTPCIPSGPVAPDRRRTLALALLGAATLLPAWPPAAAQQRRPTDPLLLGVEASLEISGLVVHLLRAMTRDTGLPVRYTAGASEQLVAQAERGEFDAILSQAPQAEELRVRRGLLHDRRLVATGEYVIAGPGGRQGDPAKIGGLTDAAQALSRIAAAGAAGRCSFITAGGSIGGGVPGAEAALWKMAGPQPAGAWMKPAPTSAAAAALDLARELRAYLLVESGVFAALSGPRTRGLEVLVRGDPRMSAPYHVMRAFRVNHPGGKLLVSWLTGRMGRAALRRFGRGYQVPSPGR
jgi:tungstate transport system substrate-binding protein